MDVETIISASAWQLLTFGALASVYWLAGELQENGKPWPLWAIMFLPAVVAFGGPRDDSNRAASILLTCAVVALAGRRRLPKPQQPAVPQPEAEATP